MKWKLVLFALLPLMFVVGERRAQALPSGASGFDTLYYADASMSEVVGEYYMGCTGTPVRSGERTAYSDTLSWQCQPSGGGTGGGSCQTTQCEINTDAAGNKYYTNCVTTTSNDKCFWRMCGGTTRMGDPEECAGN